MQALRQAARVPYTGHCRLTDWSQQQPSPRAALGAAMESQRPNPSHHQHPPGAVGGYALIFTPAGVLARIVTRRVTSAASSLQLVRQPAFTDAAGLVGKAV